MSRKKRVVSVVSTKSKNVIGRKWILCRECGIHDLEVGSDIKSAVCAYCVQRSVAPPETKQRPEGSDKFPRGWALQKRYVHTDGRIFSRGKEVVETPQTKRGKPNAKAPV